MTASRALKTSAYQHFMKTKAAKDDPELHEKMWSSPEIMGANTRGHAVMRLITMHPNVTNKILMTLAGSPELYLVGDIAANDGTPQAVLEDIF